jgi:hypothetical protein
MLVLALEAVFGLAVVTFAAFGAGGWIAKLLPSSFRRFERIAFVLLGAWEYFRRRCFWSGIILSQERQLS